jgi:hypothetical protein
MLEKTPTGAASDRRTGAGSILAFLRTLELTASEAVEVSTTAQSRVRKERRSVIECDQRDPKRPDGRCAWRMSSGEVAFALESYADHMASNHAEVPQQKLRDVLDAHLRQECYSPAAGVKVTDAMLRDEARVRAGVTPERIIPALLAQAAPGNLGAVEGLA